MSQKPLVEYYVPRPAGQLAARSAVPSSPDVWARLLARMADGDQGAARAFHAAWYPEMVRVAETIVRNDADAEEVVNDAFGQAWRRSADFDCTRGSSAAWLTTIVRSRARDLVRARGRRYRARDRMEQLATADRSVACLIPSGELDVVAALEATELRALLLRALGQLPRKQREALELVYLEGVTHTDAADRLGEPLGTVKTRVRSGLRRLRAVLGAAGATRLMY